MSVLVELQKWFHSNCDGDWEHSCGVKMETLDNPGWRVTIDLLGTPLQDIPFVEISDLDHVTDWMRCWVENCKFEAAGGTSKLEEMLSEFLKWASHHTITPPG